MVRMNQWTYAHVHRSEQDYHYLYTIKEAVPIYCSDGDDFKSKPCQQMIGWAIFHKYLMPARKMVDKRLSGPRALYIGYLVEKDGDKVVVKNLTQNKNTATKVFLSLFQGEEQKYKAGCIGHSQRANEWFSPVSALKGSEKNLDVYEAIARYAQTEHKLYEKHSLSEADAHLVTKKQILERQQKALKALQDLNKAEGAYLFQAYRFYLFRMNRASKDKKKWFNGNVDRNMKNAVNYWIRYIFNEVIKKNHDHAFLLVQGDLGKPLLCSNKDMKSDECRIMYGYWSI